MIPGKGLRLKAILGMKDTQLFDYIQHVEVRIGYCLSDFNLTSAMKSGRDQAATKINGERHNDVFI